MADTVIHLVRHGMCDSLRLEANRFAGTLPGIGLSAQGRTEAARLADALQEASLEWVASSPLQRTMETAESIVKGRGIPVSTDERLVEWRLTPWEGLSVDEIQIRCPVEWRVWSEDPSKLRLPGVESLGQVADRIEAAFREWAARGGTGLLVSHQDPLAALLCRLIGIPLERMRTLVLLTGSLSKCRQPSHGVVVDTINALSPLV